MVSFHTLRTCGHTTFMLFFTIFVVVAYIRVVYDGLAWAGVVLPLFLGLAVESATLGHTIAQLWPFFRVAIRVRTGLLAAMFVRFQAFVWVAAVTLAVGMLAIVVSVESMHPAWAMAPMYLQSCTALFLYLWIKRETNDRISVVRTHGVLHLFSLALTLLLTFKTTSAPYLSWWIVFSPLWLLLASAVVILISLMFYVFMVPISRWQRLYFLSLYCLLIVTVVVPCTVCLVIFTTGLDAGLDPGYQTAFAVAFFELVVLWIAFAVLVRSQRRARRARQHEIEEAQAALARALAARLESAPSAPDAGGSGSSLVASTTTPGAPALESITRTPQSRNRIGPPPLPEIAIYESDNEFEAATNETCVICFDDMANTILQDCGHNQFCIACARQVRKCPLCRAPIVGIVHRLPESARDAPSRQALAAFEMHLRYEHQLQRLAHENGSAPTRTPLPRIRRRIGPLGSDSIAREGHVPAMAARHAAVSTDESPVSSTHVRSTSLTASDRTSVTVAGSGRRTTRIDEEAPHPRAVTPRPIFSQSYMASLAERSRTPDGDALARFLAYMPMAAGLLPDSGHDDDVSATPSEPQLFSLVGAIPRRTRSRSSARSSRRSSLQTPNLVRIESAETSELASAIASALADADPDHAASLADRNRSSASPSPSCRPIRLAR
ncbi:uncharacterized protein AMSG_06995 [Thecamonas trahens ATCC 50062]|uniref:RING-type domain-containing protein n=1 Tax=Thecamonas trahens ATCC 50062 TaxID=461836 RepID=A0A0L0DFF0_THETB|nr:hypothetical protein AMSG_06995 [Thecamonas trahens ATCC 50062]KNC51019.1 hypothetical protein AMSG_06995 [Thecamonas trahens ATCC 50062]|eukprot:XP_013756486.1 hypothetical protein AMSG_06995 [Thecamonas trahens ATCC 50062]